MTRDRWLNVGAVILFVTTIVGVLTVVVRVWWQIWHSHCV